MLCVIRRTYLRLLFSFSLLDWRSRLFWYEMFTVIYGENILPMYLPSSLIALLNDITSSSHINDQQHHHHQYLWTPINKTDLEKNETNGVIDSENWGLLLNGCRMSNKLSEELFKVIFFFTHIFFF